MLDLTILLEGMTCFEPRDGMCACVYTCVCMLHLVWAIEIYSIFNILFHKLYIFCKTIAHLFLLMG